jgi:hypothetical protein
MQFNNTASMMLSNQAQLANAIKLISQGSPCIYKYGDYFPK